MARWTKNPSAAEPVVVDERAGTPYQGDPRAIFFHEGFHYAVRFDSDGNELGPDWGTKLVWRDGGYHHARPEDPSHFHVHGMKPVALEVE